MQKTAISVNLKASKLGISCLLAVTLVLILAAVLHPLPWVAVLCIPLVLMAGLRWHFDWGDQAPRRLEFFEDNWWLTDAQGEVYPLRPLVLWRSFVWVAIALPSRPQGLGAWLLWPDAVDAEQRRQLRVYLSRS